MVSLLTYLLTYFLLVCLRACLLTYSPTCLLTYQVILPPGCGSLGGLCMVGERLLVTDPQVRRLHEFVLFRDRRREEEEEARSVQIS